MNKKLLIFALAIAGLFLFSTCGDDDGPPVDDLWYKIRNTTWQLEKTDMTWTIGFYSPSTKLANYTYVDPDKNIIPTCIIRYIPKNPPEDSWLKAGKYYVNGLGISIDRTGHRISDAFSVSLSEDGDKLKIYSAEIGPGNGYNANGTYTRVTDPNFAFDDGRRKTLEKIQNTAWTKQGDSKISIGFYEDNKGPLNRGGNYSINVKNSLGYRSAYRASGNAATVDDPVSIEDSIKSWIYLLLKTQDGVLTQNITINEDGIYFTVDSYPYSMNAEGYYSNDYNSRSSIEFKLTLSDNNNTLTLSLTPQEINIWDEKTHTSTSVINENNLMFSDDISVYDIEKQNGTRYSNDKFCELFNGTYTKSPSYNWNEDREKAWNQIKNTAWKRQDYSNPSIGFYEMNDKGPLNYGPSDYLYGYVYFKTQDNFYTNYTLPNNGISISGTQINLNVIFKIAVSGNTLTISDVHMREHNIGNINGGYTTIKEKMRFDNIYGGSSVEYDEDMVRSFLTGTYTLQPGYVWN